MKQNVPRVLKSLHENLIQEGHGFRSAVTGPAILGFSCWGTVFLTSQFSCAMTKRCPQRLKPGKIQAIMARLKPCPSKDRVFTQTLRLSSALRLGGTAEQVAGKVDTQRNRSPQRLKPPSYTVVMGGLKAVPFKNLHFPATCEAVHSRRAHRTKSELSFPLGRQSGGRVI